MTGLVLVPSFLSSPEDDASGADLQVERGGRAACASGTPRRLPPPLSESLRTDQWRWPALGIPGLAGSPAAERLE